MTNPSFDFGRLYEMDREIAVQYLGSLYRPPDLIIAPLGHGEYLYRWYIVPRNREANVYFHVQTASDPERPLHDHPWDNTSVLLAGAYEELLEKSPVSAPRGSLQGLEGRSPSPFRCSYLRTAGDVVHRKAEWAHRLILPDSTPYMMSLFVTGPKRRDWGFWTESGWVAYKDVTIEIDGRSSWKDNI
jgi:hypothetical protein